VKFDGDKLPAIYNAITTINNGQKLVLEVAVRDLIGVTLIQSHQS
jgi:hypothetical protein